MKIVIRILNVVIIAIAAVAAVFLFMPPAFSFKSKITLNVDTFSQFVPETEYSKDIDIPTLLGTDVINVGLQFELDIAGINEMKDGNKDKINEKLVSKNVDDIVTVLHEPVDLITEFAIRTNIKKLVSEQVYNYVDQALENYKSSHPGSEKAISSSTDDILEEVGIDDDYYTNFSNELYDTANAENATVDSVNNVLYDQINEALVRAKRSGVVDISSFGDDAKENIRSSIVSVFNSLNLVKEDGNSLEPIGQIAYVYLATYLKKELTDVLSPSELERKSEESAAAYSDRLLEAYVLNKMPDIFYQIVGYVSLGLFIGVFVFAGIWALLIVITLIKTFTKKPWTFFGPWFWIVGIVELILGFGITALARFALRKVDIASLGLPIQNLLVSIKTYAFIPSILFIVCIALAIVYTIIKKIAKHSIV